MTAQLIDNSIAVVTPGFGTSLNSLASSSTLLAGVQSDKFDLGSQIENLSYDVHAKISGNTGAAPTENTLCQLWYFASYDDTVYEGGGVITNAGTGAKTLTEQDKAQGSLIFSLPWNDATSFLIQVTRSLLIGRPGLLAPPRYGVLWLTQSSGQNLHSSGHSIVLKPRNIV